MFFLDVLFYAFIIVVVIQLIYYGIIFGRLAAHKNQIPTSKNIGVSIIICAKNEAENLATNLPLFLDQDYPNFEVVLINDHSSDDTLEMMEGFKERHPNVKIVDVKPIEKFWGNKKYALTLGIKVASHEHLLFTDADCTPLSRQWIKEMASHFSEEKTLVIGYGAYKKKKGSLLNVMIRFETFMTAVQYFSYAKIGLPYMAVGRNLAYKKTQFFEANGFVNHMDIMSGDDDLFVNQVATKSNVALCISEDSFTESIPKKNLNAWMLQKHRHLGSAHFYKTKHKVLLALFYISQLLFWTLSIVLIIFLHQWHVVLGLVALRFIVQFINLGLGAKKLNETGLMYWLPLLEISLISFQFFIFIKNLTSKPQYWK
ncbi:glycosyltransferase [Psychroserpens sp.]|uniref:glycosyltransferase n=1 Tax=Psychroserpens sp. TaxID=2020870 RepID=UPI003C766D42